MKNLIVRLLALWLTFISRLGKLFIALPMMVLCADETNGVIPDDSEMDEFTAKRKWDQFEHTLLSRKMRFTGSRLELSPGDEMRLRTWVGSLKTKEDKLIALEKLSLNQFLGGCIANGALHRDLVQVLMRDQDREVALRAAHLAWPKSYWPQCKPEIDALLINASASEALILCFLFPENVSPEIDKKLDDFIKAEKDPFAIKQLQECKSTSKKPDSGERKDVAISFPNESPELILERFENGKANASIFRQIRDLKSKKLVKKMEELARRPNPASDRREALVTLLFIDGNAQEDLFVKMLDDTESQIRETAAYCLGDLRLSKHAEKIEKLLQGSPDTPQVPDETKECVAFVLGAMRDQKSPPVIK